MNARLVTPKIAVVYETENGNLAEIVVKASVYDMTRYELMAARKGWPPASKAQNLFGGYLAHAALQRAEDCPPELKIESLDKFLAEIVNLVPVDDEGEDVNPFDPAAQ
ncbi:hypothetical protein [Canibacter zhoujuaniae]|uniref:hypothetical protein n=1 Tax=Canibacter zhoujuaniae TaxID=2708343 RepID=UPI001421D2F2|nr:hypothetical protein [Canibacter zhoujuaniae]